MNMERTSINQGYALLGVKLIKPKWQDFFLFGFSSIALFGIRYILTFVSQVPPSLADLVIFSVICAFGLHTIGLSLRKNLVQFISVITLLNLAFMFYKANIYVL